MALTVLTYCFAQSHFETLLSVLPEWSGAFGSDCILVGYSERQAPEGFADQVRSLGVTALPVHSRFYGNAYDTLLSEREWEAAVILAPYAIPQPWLVGSLNSWLSQFVLVGRFKPPRIMNAETLMIPLVAPVIVELGRMNFDFLAFRSDVKFLVNTEYREWLLGSILVRARPGAFMIFNILASGYPILTLPSSVKPVRYVARRSRRRQ